MLKNESKQLIDFLNQQGHGKTEDIKLFESALALSALRHPSRSLDRYYHALERLEQYVQNNIAEQGADHGDAKLAALKKAFTEDSNYSGNKDHYDLIDNADICYVIDNGKGLPVALSILYIDVCERLGWHCEGVNFPGHFLLRLHAQGQQILFDPFYDARIVGAADLRQLIKQVEGPNAELDQAYYRTADKRQILVRLQNNIKNRQIAAEDYEAALDTVIATEYLAPDEYRLLLDKGVLLAKNEQSSEAIETLERYMTLTPYAEDRADARMFIEQIHQDSFLH